MLPAQEVQQPPITEEGLKALDSNVFTNEFMVALKPAVNRDRIAKIRDPFVRRIAQQMADKKYDSKSRTMLAEPYEPVKDLADRLNIAGLTDKGGSDKVKVILHPESDVCHILLGQGGQMDMDAGDIDGLIGG